MLTISKSIPELTAYINFSLGSHHWSSSKRFHRPSASMPLTRRQARQLVNNTAPRPSRLAIQGDDAGNSITTGKRGKPESKSNEAKTTVATLQSTPQLTTSVDSSTPLSFTHNAEPSLQSPKRKKGKISTGSAAPSISGKQRIKDRPTGNPDIEDASSLPTPELVGQILDRLSSFYRGPLSTATHPKTKPRKAVLDSLVATILSQATSNVNSSRAFANLKARFPSWESAVTAGTKEIEKCIACGGLAQAKSKVINNILSNLKEKHGDYSLEFIREMSTDNAKKVLCSFKGVGPKTASCVLMFALHRAEFPVDTHIRRISSRLGWTPRACTPEKTYDLLNPCIPHELKYHLHVMLIEHGRKTCKAKSPRCSDCPVNDLCPFSEGS